MRTVFARIGLFVLFCAASLLAQQGPPPAIAARLIRVANVFQPENGLPISPVESVTVSVYRDEHGGIPLWSETQNVEVDPQGRYTVLIGSTLPAGLPLELFPSSESRWLGVQFNRLREVEQPRVLLVGVPYALKAADAEMLAGKPASAYLLAEPDSGNEGPRMLRTGSDRARIPPTTNDGLTMTPRVNSGTTNCIGVFANSTDLGCSVMWQSGNRIGVGTASPGAALNVVGQAAIGSGGSPQSYGFDLYVNATNPVAFLDAYGTPGTASLILQGRNSGGATNHQFSVSGSGVLTVTPSSMRTPALTLTQAGTVGIGYSNPGPAWANETLGVMNTAAGTRSTALNLINGSGNTGTAISLDFSPNVNIPLARINASRTNASGYFAGDTDLEFYNYGGGMHQQMILKASGNVGIGNSMPAYRLDVAGAIRSSAGGFVFPDGTMQTTAATSGGSGTSPWTTVGGGALSYSGGNVGIGTTAPGWKLDVAGDINFSGTLRYQGKQALQVTFNGGVTSAGYHALDNLTTGTNVTALGFNVLSFNTTGNQNTATGGYSMYSNTAGSYNTADGYGALQSNTTGNYSTAIGFFALSSATGTGFNTATGSYSLAANTIGQDNTGTGYSVLASNTVGSQNTGVGYAALYSNIAGINNTGIGFNALYTATGSNNIGIGYQAGYFVSGNSNNIHIGHAGTSLDNATIRIGTPGTQTSFFAAGIRGVTTGINNAVPVYIDSNGQLGTVNSSRKFKEDIRDMGGISSGLMRLRPVTFRYRQPFANGSKPVQYGLIAEEVAEVYPDMVARSADGEIETVKYQVLDVMLLNEVQRQQTEIEFQNAQIRRLEQQVELQQQQSRTLELRLAKLEAAVRNTP